MIYSPRPMVYKDWYQSQNKKTQRFGRLGWFWVVWGRNYEFKGSMLVVTAK
jgi:hypothetical protein